MVAWTFLLVNGFEVVSSAAEAERFLLDVAQGRHELAEMADWLRRRARKLK